jgi:hypothetical protein
MICKNLKSHILYLKSIVCLGLLIVSVPLFSQQNKDTSKVAIVKHKILLVPFKPTMLMSEIGKAVYVATNLSYNKAAEAFRYRMDLALYNTFKRTYSTVSLMQAPQKGDTTLPYIYNSIGYKYELLPGRDTSGESHAEFDQKQQKSHFVHNGQLQVPQDYSKRFMNATIEDTRLLPYINKKDGADILVFVNEVDIKNIANNETDDLTQSNTRREVIVQYSIINMQNHYLARGMLTTYFPYTENDPKVIGAQYFTNIAQSMLKELNKGLQKLEPKTKKSIVHKIKPLSKEN